MSEARRSAAAAFFVAPFFFAAPVLALFAAGTLFANMAQAQTKSVPITIRDFNASHADFEDAGKICKVDGGGVKDMVELTLDAEH